MTTSESRILEDLAARIIAAEAFHIRDVDAGEEPFLYSSGNKGPGFCSIKGLVSETCLRDALVAQLASRITNIFPDIDFVAANCTGGVPPGILLAQDLSHLLGRDVPVVYVRNVRKRGGLKEHVTGLNDHNPALKPGARCLIVEELVNFATTTTNSAILMRGLGYTVEHAAAIVFYDTKPAHELLEQEKVQLNYLLTIHQLIDVAQKRQLFAPHLIQSYRDFLNDPAAWMTKRGLVRDEKGGT